VCETGNKSRDKRGSSSKEMEVSAIVCEKAMYTYVYIRKMRLSLLEESIVAQNKCAERKRGKVGQCDVRNVNKVNNVT